MGYEIERKFIVKNKEYKQAKYIEKLNIKQGYITLDKKKVIRLRILNEKARLTLKGLATKITRYEFEYEIPVQEAEQMLQLFCHKPIIKKIRYKIEYQGNLWEIDEFKGENSGLIIAEIELDSEDQRFQKPGYIGREVTEDERFYNFNLVKNPYKNWEKEV